MYVHSDIARVCTRIHVPGVQVFWVFWGFSRVFFLGFLGLDGRDCITGTGMGLTSRLHLFFFRYFFGFAFMRPADLDTFPNLFSFWQFRSNLQVSTHVVIGNCDAFHMSITCLQSFGLAAPLVLQDVGFRARRARHTAASLVLSTMSNPYEQLLLHVHFSPCVKQTGYGKHCGPR